jgi:hypothetical protein
MAVERDIDNASVLELVFVPLDGIYYWLLDTGCTTTNCKIIAVNYFFIGSHIESAQVEVMSVVH